MVLAGGLTWFEPLISGFFYENGSYRKKKTSPPLTMVWQWLLRWLFVVCMTIGLLYACIWYMNQKECVLEDVHLKTLDEEEEEDMVYL
jgi:hypothetical protein